MSFQASEKLQAEGCFIGCPTRTPALPGGRSSPRGLMVLSSASLSLGFPLDMRAAIENAFAREESCGFGDDVYSMVGTRGTNSLQNPKAPNRTYMRFSSAKILADTEKEKNNFAGLFLVFLELLFFPLFRDRRLDFMCDLLDSW